MPIKFVANGDIVYEALRGPSNALRASFIALVAAGEVAICQCVREQLDAQDDGLIKELKAYGIKFLNDGESEYALAAHCCEQISNPIKAEDFREYEDLIMTATHAKIQSATVICITSGISGKTAAEICDQFGVGMHHL